MSTSKGTVRLHRVLAAPVERVYRAFLDSAATAKWLPPYGFTCTVHEMNVHVGGGYKMSFTNFTSGKSHSFSGKYIEIKQNEKLSYTDKFDDPNLPGDIQVSITFRSVSCGTELEIVQSGLPEAIPVEQCYLGWQQSLNQLTQLVEPEILDQVSV